MKTTRISTCIAAIVLPLSFAAASAHADTPGPLVLTDHEMDRVSAGGPTSVAGGTATAWFGTASSSSHAWTWSSGPVHVSAASSLNLAIGTQTNATAFAWTVF